jgi:hypothetical protein
MRYQVSYLQMNLRHKDWHDWVLAHMQQWADAGWRLVSTQQFTYPNRVQFDCFFYWEKE